MTSFHCRSNSFPSQSHPAINDVQDRLERLKASSQATSSTSASSIISNLASLRDLHDGINNLIQMPSIQQALAHEQGGQSLINELLEGSLRIVDLCGLSRDVVCLTKESIQDLESSIRRKPDDHINVASRKKIINKMVNKCIKNNLIKSSSIQNSTQIPTIGMMIKESESVELSILKSVLILLSGEEISKTNKKSWPFLSKFAQSTTRVHNVAAQESRGEDLCSLNIIHKSLKGIDNKNMLKQLKTSEMTIQEIENGLEALLRSLVKTRVSLLNVLSH